jgi:hypothetical protein
MNTDILFYSGIVLLIVGAWQTFRRGAHSEVIGGLLLLFILGTILVFTGNRQVGLFVIYLFASWLLLMQLFRISTYRKYFSHIVPFVLVYAVLVAFLLQYFNFQDFSWWYLGLSTLFLFINLKRQFQSKDAVDMFAQIDKNIIEAVPEGEVRQQVQKELASGGTIRQYLLGVVAAFIVSFVVAASLFSALFSG